MDGDTGYMRFLKVTIPYIRKDLENADQGEAELNLDQTATRLTNLLSASAANSPCTSYLTYGRTWRTLTREEEEEEEGKKHHQNRQRPARVK